MDLDALFARLAKENAGYTKRLAELGPDSPAHWGPNIRNAWCGQVRIIVEGVIAGAMGRGRARRRAELEAQIAADPRWAQVLEVMRKGGALA